ncbi:MAG: hypothetical protein HKL82_07560 [Acidimicrobiaceae bacterium]|nr:hypothetical protein [Acidimicrobiaceae bacterium]
MRCSVCNESTVVEVRLVVNSHVVVMKSCSICDSRSWTKDGVEMAVTGILEAASKR